MPHLHYILLVPSIKLLSIDLCVFSHSFLSRLGIALSLLAPSWSWSFSFHSLSSILVIGTISGFGFRLSLVNTWFQQQPYAASTQYQVDLPTGGNSLATRLFS